MNKDETIKLEKAIVPIVSKAVQVSINSANDMKGAVEILSVLNKYNDEVKERKETITKPLNEALRNARALFKPIEEKLESGISAIRNAMSEYQTLETKRVKEEEAKIAARVGDGKGKLQIDTAVRKIGEIERADKEVATDEGKVKFREDKVLKVTNINAIPREYFDLNESRLLKDLKAGVQVSGAEVEIKMVPLNFR